MSVLRPRGALCLLLLASGCKGCQSEDTLPALLEAEDATPVGVWVSEGLGAAPVTMTAFATNAVGAVVPSGDLTITSDATVTAAPVGVDGWVDLEVQGDVGANAVTAAVDGLSGDGAAWLTAADAGNVDAHAAPLPGTPRFVARAGSGVAAAVGADVWWTGFDGRQPARVLALPEDVTGMFAAEIDADGVSDLVVTSATRVAVLRGRDGGGLVWGGGWNTVDGRTVVGASVADFDGDNANDLAVALAESDTLSHLSIVGGDGTWGFTPIDALEVPYAVHGVSLDDLDGNGIGEVTFLTADGLLRRYTKIDGAWAATLTSSQFDLQMGPGSRLLPSVDLDADGVPDLVAYGPSLEGAEWLAWIVTPGAADPVQYPIVSAGSGYAWVGVATGDLTGDGLADLVYTAPGKLSRGVWAERADVPGEFTFSLQAWSDAPSHAAVAIVDVDADTVADVVVGGTDLRVFPGARVADDPATPDEDETVAWKIATPETSTFGLDLLVPPVVGDVTGDAVTDIVGLVLPTGGAGVALQGLLGVAATDTARETLRSGGSLTVSGSGAALDLAVCGARAYVLYEEADDVGNVGTWLVRADLGASVGPTLDGAPIAVTGDVLACGAFALGEVAVADAAGAVSYVDAVGAVTAGDSVGAAGDIAAADTDGDGVDEVVACEGDGCAVYAADLDGDGTTDLAVQDADGIVVTIGGADVTVDADGALHVADADGDGVADVIVGLDGLARVYRGVDGLLSPPVASWTWRPVADAAHFGDLDGDGLPDAFYVGEDHYPDTADGDDWAGALVYARAE